jgi:hypothetical protein
MLLFMSTNIYALNHVQNLWHSFFVQEIKREESPLDCQPSLAHETQNDLWQKISACPYEILPPLREDKFFEHLWASFLAQDISSPLDELKPFEASIFRHGSVAKIRFVAHKKHEYTGIFQTGAAGIIRISWENCIPALQLKFFVDDNFSLNMRAVENIIDQNSHQSFFARSFSNERPIFQSSFWKFAAWLCAYNKLSYPGSSIAFARIENNGKLCYKYKAPSCLYFVPSKEVILKSFYMGFQDFREELALLEPPVILYQVMACAEQGADAEVIGDIVLESPFVASAFGDQQLFFNF